MHSLLEVNWALRFELHKRVNMAQDGKLVHMEVLLLSVEPNLTQAQLMAPYPEM